MGGCPYDGTSHGTINPMSMEDISSHGTSHTSHGIAHGISYIAGDIPWHVA